MQDELHSYDRYLVAFSGGKDSIACLLHLIEMGVDRSRIELWHHDIDGEGEPFMDWECTKDYCRQFAHAFGLPIFFSWKEGGFEREMLRDNSLTAPVIFEDEHHRQVRVGGKLGQPATRRRFPQVSADLSVRWCSAYLKIDVMARAIANQKRFRNTRTLILSGERGEESPQRAAYAIHEADRTDLRDGVRYTRHIDRHRPIRDWKEAEVWAIIERHRVRPHPAYYLGWSRVSCKFCIFGNAHQFASAYSISPAQGDRVIAREKEFGCTVKRDTDLTSLINQGTVYPAVDDDELVRVATSPTYSLPIFTENWQLPAGAFGEGCGPQ